MHVQDGGLTLSLNSLEMKPRTTLLQEALAAATDTRMLRIGSKILGETPDAFRSQFGAARAIVIADENTFRVAGKAVQEAFRTAGILLEDPYIFTDPDLYAEYRFVERLDQVVGATPAIPVAVGSGTINDLTKLASHHAGRPYMVIPTAASMDGYTAYGASITFRGSKQTFNCPAPRAVVADLDVIAGAPTEMNASGYADLLAKITAGADWIVADALGVEPIDSFCWELVQEPLRYWVSKPEDVRAAKPDAIARLLEGLMMGGFAMQHHQTSRPASGAEHQFSHLWDMQHHTFNGVVPSHGFKVGIGTVASTALYEELLALPLEHLDPQEAASHWPSVADIEKEIRQLFDIPELAEKAVEEMRAKYLDREAVVSELQRLREVWPVLRARLRDHLLPRTTIMEMLSAAGAPGESEQIGVTAAQLRESYRLAYYIRRRFTVLDLAMRTALFDSCLDSIFSAAPNLDKGEGRASLGKAP